MKLADGRPLIGELVRFRYRKRCIIGRVDQYVGKRSLDVAVPRFHLVCLYSQVEIVEIVKSA